MVAKRFRRVLALCLVLASGTIIAGSWSPSDDDFFALRKNFQIFGSSYEELVGGYVDNLNPESVMRSGIEAMLADLDPYTVFFDEADNADMDILSRGRYGGVGLSIGLRNGRFTVSAPVEGASGYKQGVRAGDIITHIDGRQTDGLSLGDLRGLLRGEPGSTVEIVVTREGEPGPISFLLAREEVQVKNVTFSGFVHDDTTAGIGYIKLARFARGAAGEVRRAASDLAETDRLRGLILDLRDNPGGLLDAAVDIATLFVPNGSTIVSTRGRLPESERIYNGKSVPLLPDTPLVVLINEISASASEIVAGAIQDLDRGLIVGTPSYGKGLVQIVRPLPYNTSLKLTTARYYTPSGRSIQAIDYRAHDGNFTDVPDSLRQTFTTSGGRTVRDGNGIEPDILVPLPAASELEQALERRAAFFFYANHYAAENRGASVENTVSDETLVAFRRWLDGQSFSYTTTVEHGIKALKDTMIDTGYEAAESEVQALNEKIERLKEQAFERNKEALRRRLRFEIVARFLDEPGQILASMRHDPFLQAAFEAIRDARQYDSLLGDEG